MNPLQTLIKLTEVLPLFGLALLALYGNKLLHAKNSFFNLKEELTEKNNSAVGLVLVCYLIGVAIALIGAFPSKSEGLMLNSFNMCLNAVLITVLMKASFLLNKRVTLFWFKEPQEIETELKEQQSLGTAYVVGASSLATGIMLAGVLSGESDSIWHAIRDTVVFWALGQGLLCCGSHLFAKFVHYDIKGAIEKDNNAASGISFGGFLVALGIVAYAGLQGATSNLLSEFGTILTLSVVGLTILLTTGIVSSHILMPHANMAKEIAVKKNVAAGLISAGAFITSAILLMAAVR